MIFRINDCLIDTNAYEVRRNGKPVPVQPQVLDLLVLLLENRDRLVTKDEIIARVWHGRAISDAALDSRIKSARQAIGDTGASQDLIRTVRGRGFRFVGEVIGDALEQAAEPEVPATAVSTADTAGARPHQEVTFCRTSDGVHLAIAAVGDGPPLIKTANWLTHIEYEWQSPVWSPLLTRLASQFRLVRYDERGNGLSDWDVADISFDAFVRDLESVVDALRLERFALFGISQGAAVSIAYAVRHPERVSRLVLFGGYAYGWRKRGTADHIARREMLRDLIPSGWGQDNPAFRQVYTSLFIPGGTLEEMQWFNDLMRVSASPENAVRLVCACADIDVADLLPQVAAPTLVLHSRGDAIIQFEQGLLLARAIPNARFVALDSRNHLLLAHEPAWHRLVDEMCDFLGEPDGRGGKL